MGDFYQEDRLWAAYNDRRDNPGTSATTIGSALFTVAAGVYVLYKILDSLGYPVWLWAHMALGKLGSLWTQDMVSTDAAGEDTQGSMLQRGGNMLGSMFGLKDSGFIQKGVRGVTSALAKGTSDVPPGLSNWDNSCFQNSIIQGLASLPSLRKYLSNTTGEFRSLNTDTTNGGLFDMIRKLNDPDNHGRSFSVSGRLKSMNTFMQQDAQEYYSKILDALDKEVQGAINARRRSSVSWLDATLSLGESISNSSDADKNIATEGDSGAENEKPLSARSKIAPNPLDGLLAQRVGCIKCGYSEGLQLIPFNCVTVSLGRAYEYDIRDCLDEYTQLEDIEGVECAKCTLLKLKDTLAPLVANGAPFGPRLQAVEEALEDDDLDDKTLVKKFNILKKNWVQSTKSKQAVVARAPKALVLHVNRSIFNEMTGEQYKNTAAVAYPQVLDLGNWCLGSRPSESHLPDNEEEEWPRDPTKSMIGDTHKLPSTASSFQYQLRATVAHSGTHGYGHYVCYRRHAKLPDSPAQPQDDGEKTGLEQWWRFSDDSVYAVSEAQAHQGNVFMLFYERIDASTPALLEDEQTAQTMLTIDVPLPPAHLDPLATSALDDTAVSVPLPEDGDDDDLESLPDLVPSLEIPSSPSTVSPPSSPKQRPASPPDPKPHISPAQFAGYPTPPPESPRVDLEKSQRRPTDTSSVNSMTGDQAPPTPAPPRSKFSPSPRLMRTAGQSPSGGGDRRSLPMVTAT